MLAWSTPHLSYRLDVLHGALQWLPERSQMDPGDLAKLIPDWRRHLRATNRAASTVRRCEKDTRRSLPSLQRTGLLTQASALTREHLEHFLADEQSRPPPPRTR